MKKLIKKNPKKALRISLILFVSLMAANGVIVFFTQSFLCALLIPFIAISQILYVSKWSNYYVAAQVEELKNQIFEKMNSIDIHQIEKCEVNEFEEIES